MRSGSETSDVKPSFTFCGYAEGMSVIVTDETIFEALKKIQCDVAQTKVTVAETVRLLGLMRDYELRLESMYATTLLRLDRIERRFGFG